MSWASDLAIIDHMLRRRGREMASVKELTTSSAILEPLPRCLESPSR